MFETKIETGAALQHSGMRSSKRSKLGLKEGAIRRLRLQSFMAFDDVLIEPGPGLNVLVGPNGSGKSSIVTAICLVFGGSLKSATRGSEVSSFIKDAQEKATIEVWLHKDSDTSIKVTRVLLRNKRNSSQWKIDDEDSSFKSVSSLLSNFNINVDNLCQFLAQDRVSSFTRLDPRNLLVETEKALGSQFSLWKLHQELMDWEHNGDKLNVIVEEKKKLLDQAQAQLTRLEEEAQGFQLRQDLVHKLKVLNAKRLFLDVDKQQAVVLAIQSEYNSRRQELHSLEVNASWSKQIA